MDIFEKYEQEYMNTPSWAKYMNNIGTECTS